MRNRIALIITAAFLGTLIGVSSISAGDISSSSHFKEASCSSKCTHVTPSQAKTDVSKQSRSGGAKPSAATSPLPTRLSTSRLVSWSQSVPLAGVFPHAPSRAKDARIAIPSEPRRSDEGLSIALGQFWQWVEVAAANENAQKAAAAAAAHAAYERSLHPVVTGGGGGWSQVAICEEGGRNDGTYGYFGILPGNWGDGVSPASSYAEQEAYANKLNGGHAPYAPSNCAAGGYRGW